MEEGQVGWSKEAMRRIVHDEVGEEGVIKILNNHRGIDVDQSEQIWQGRGRIMQGLTGHSNEFRIHRVASGNCWKAFKKGSHIIRFKI